jgi:hypothetical protein
MNRIHNYGSTRVQHLAVSYDTGVPQDLASGPRHNVTGLICSTTSQKARADLGFSVGSSPVMLSAQNRFQASWFLKGHLLSPPF